MSDPAAADFTVDGYFQSQWAHYFIFGCAILSIVWGVINVLMIRAVDLTDPEPIEKFFREEKADSAVNDDDGDAKEKAQAVITNLQDIGGLITDGAIQFLAAEYTYLGVFCLAFALVIGFTVDMHEMSTEAYPLSPSNFPYTATAFLVGAGTSILSGYIGMRIAVYTNSRTTYNCCKGESIACDVPDVQYDKRYLDDLVKFYDIKKKAAATAAQAGGDGKMVPGETKDLKEGFMTAFQGGQVLGFCLVGLALLVLEVILLVFKATWFDTVKAGVYGAAAAGAEDKAIAELIRRHFEFVAGYGLGGSTVALFGRVGGGIYTKAADVGADLVGKVVAGLEEDSPENPGTIADNVGDNVGDIAGMGADLFGSLAESTCAALVVSSTSAELIRTPDALYFPLIVSSVGIIASFISVLCANFFTVTVHTVQYALKMQLLISTVLMTIALVPAVYILPESFSFVVERATGTDASGATIFENVSAITTGPWQAFGCIMFGLWSGMVIGFVTEYYTSNAYEPTLKLYRTCRQGAATNVIQGLALGYTSCIVPIFCITATIGYAFAVAGMYGIGLAAIGMLGSLPVALTIDGYGPISDNAGGLAEMSELPSAVRDRTDALDAAGNTTAAIGKGFAIGSACLVGLALFGAFVTRIEQASVDILKPIQFCGLLVGAMLPYWFSALTMVAVGNAAESMMFEIMEDMARVETEREGHEPGSDGFKAIKPDYMKCIRVSTEASLLYMVAPGLLVIITPIAAGILFGYRAVEGLLAGIIVSGVQVAISASNTGGAWDNAKKETEKQRQLFYSFCKEAWPEGAFAAAKAGDDFKGWVKEQSVAFDKMGSGWDETDETARFMLVLQAINEQKNASVVGDTVGDPLKDTSGPAINILIKLSAITSLVFGSYIKSTHWLVDE